MGSMLPFAALCINDRTADKVTKWERRQHAVCDVSDPVSSCQYRNLEKHPDKTFIGRIERGFDFFGYHFSTEGLTVARKTIENFVKKASRLYEQERRTVSTASPLEMYVRRWMPWVRSGLTTQAMSAGMDWQDARHQSSTAGPSARI